MIRVKEFLEPDEKWNDRLISSELGTIYQTIERAKIIKDKGMKPVFFTICRSR